MRELIIGPILEDVERADFTAREVVLATAFYSAIPLDTFQVHANHLSLLVRLNTVNLKEWIDGMVDPPALLRFVERHETRGVIVDLRRSRSAHAKAYVGRQSFLIGSANFTGNGLCGKGQEILWRDSSSAALRDARTALAVYADGLSPMTTDQLRLYVARNEPQVVAARKGQSKTGEDVPKIVDGRAPRLGNYADFLTWLNQQPSAAAQELYARAHGKSQLSGHVQNCFYGGRQLLVLDPAYRRRLVRMSPEAYRVFGDSTAVSRIKHFSLREVVNEPGFQATVWRNISPIELGGRVGRRGGLIGSLNRALPLLARYLGDRTTG
jgi:hypothetical protein